MKLHPLPYFRYSLDQAYFSTFSSDLLLAGSARFTATLDRPVSVQTWPQELKTDSDNNLAPLLFNGFCRCLVAAKTFPLKFFFTFKIKRRI